MKDLTNNVYSFRMSFICVFHYQLCKSVYHLCKSVD